MQGRNHWGSGGAGPPNFLEDPQLLTPRFCRGVHRQASRVNSVYDTEEEKKKKFFPLLLQVLSAFLSRVSILTRDIDIANLYVCLSVRPSVRYVPVPYENGLTYRHSFFHHTVAQSF